MQTNLSSEEFINLRPKRVLVTGGTGFIGAHLLYALLKKDFEVLAFYRAEKQLRKVEKVFEFYGEELPIQSPRMTWLKADLLEPELWEEPVGKVDYLFHCAGLISFDSNEVEKMYSINVEGTLNIVKYAIKHQIRLCYLSSASALGRAPFKTKAYIDESSSWHYSSELSDYAISKYKAEKMVWKSIEDGLQVVMVNPTFVIGPGETDRGNNQILWAIWQGLNFYGPGSNGFIDVRDVVRLMIQLCDTQIHSERFILVAEHMTYRDFFYAIADQLVKKRPSIRVRKWMVELVCWILPLINIIAGRKSKISRAALIALIKEYHFSNQKICSTFPVEFIPILKSIEDTCRFFLKQTEQSGPVKS